MALTPRFLSLIVGSAVAPAANLVTLKAKIVTS